MKTILRSYESCRISLRNQDQLNHLLLMGVASQHLKSAMRKNQKLVEGKWGLLIFEKAKVFQQMC